MLNIEELLSYSKDSEYEMLANQLFPSRIYRLSDEEFAICREIFEQIPYDIKRTSPMLCTIQALLFWLYEEPKYYNDGEKWRLELKKLLLMTDEGTPENLMMNRLLSWLNISNPNTDNTHLFFHMSILYNYYLTDKGSTASLISTKGFPSIMRGAKDLTEWGRNYSAFRNLLKPMVNVFVDDDGHDTIRIAVAEILYEKNQITESHLEMASAMHTDEPELKFVNDAHLIKLTRIESNSDPLVDVTLAKLESFLKASEYKYLMPNYIAFKARLDMERGDLQAVADWVDREALDISDRKFAKLYRIITKAKALITMQKYREAITMFQGIITAYEDKHRPMDIAECYANTAIALSIIGSPQLALRNFERAISLVREYGYIRIFADLGNAIIPIIDDYCSMYSKDKYISTIREEAVKFGKLYPKLYNGSNKEMPVPKVTIINTSDEDYDDRPLEDLSKTESVVLRYLSEGLSNSEIAEAMDIKLTTVKFHVKNILSKFKASNRTEAAKIGRRFGYLE